LAGVIPDGATRRVSLHDGDARPIAKGRLGTLVEFGHKAQVIDNDDGIVLDHTVAQGNPADAPQLVPAIERVTKPTGHTPGTVTADRGYGEKRLDDALYDLGMRTVVIPRKANPASSGRHRNTGRPSDEPSSGAPAVKAASGRGDLRRTRCRTGQGRLFLRAGGPGQADLDATNQGELRPGRHPQSRRGVRIVLQPLTGPRHCC
jgi:IS5 family transposase